MQSFQYQLRQLIWPVCFCLALPIIGVAQTSAPTQGNATSANVSPAGQAPDDVMKRLSDLVHAGNYAEAQRLTSGLLAAYPGDERLIKAELLLEKSLAAASPNTIPRAEPAAGNVAAIQPVASGNVESLQVWTR